LIETQYVLVIMLHNHTSNYKERY